MIRERSLCLGITFGILMGVAGCGEDVGSRPGGVNVYDPKIKLGKDRDDSGMSPAGLAKSKKEARANEKESDNSPATKDH